MHNNVGFYLVGKKGYKVLSEFIRERGAAVTSFVVASRDAGVICDYYDEIKNLCEFNSVPFFDRVELDSMLLPEVKVRFCIGWRWLISDTNRLVVFHDSPLPRYRGFAPLVNMLINGEKVLSVTGLFAEAEYDKGRILGAIDVPITYPIKIAEAIERIIPAYQELVSVVYDLVISGSQGTAQEETVATYSLWRDSQDYVIDWKKSSQEISRFCDSVGDPYLGARAYVDGKEIVIQEVEPVDDVVVESRSDHVGKIIFMNDGLPTVVCGSGLLRIRKAMLAVNGAPLSFKFRSKFTGKS